MFYLQGYNNSKCVTLEASFTPDSQFVMIGKLRLLFLCCFCFNIAEVAGFITRLELQHYHKYTNLRKLHSTWFAWLKKKDCLMVQSTYCMKCLRNATLYCHTAEQVITRLYSLKYAQCHIHRRSVSSSVCFSFVAIFQALRTERSTYGTQRAAWRWLY